MALTKIGNVTVNNNYTYKKVNQNIINNLNVLINKKFHHLPKYEIIDGKIVCPYYKQVSVPTEVLQKDLMKIVAVLHKITCYEKVMDKDFIKSIYEHNEHRITRIRSIYLGYYDYAFNQIYHSPSQYYLLKNFHYFIEAIDKSKNLIDKFYEITKEKRSVRFSMIHGNLNFEHLIKTTKRDLLVSWDHSRYDLPLTDLYYLITNERVKFNFDIFENYFQIFSFLEEELFLLFSLILLPNSIDDNLNEFDLCCFLDKEAIRISKTISYIDKVVEKYDFSKTSEE